MKKLWFLVIPLFFIACEKDSLEIETLGANSSIIGTWVDENDPLYSPEEGNMRFNRSDELDPDRYGFTFFDDGSFTERKNSGWCGTPPIAYDNFEGNWNPLNDTLIDITVAYWGGIMTYQMWIVSLEGDRLSVRYLYTEDRVEVE